MFSCLLRTHNSYIRSALCKTGVEQKRLTAAKVWIGDVHSGTFVKKSDAPAAVILPDTREVSRVNLMGIVVGVDEGVVVDDGTGSILVRAFDKPFNAAIGDSVIVVGLLREYFGEKYIAGEVVKKISASWFDVRKRELPRAVQVLNDEKITAADENTRALELIRSLDSGEGADYDAVVSKLSQNGEELIAHLLANGDLFETRPGRLKILE